MNTVVELCIDDAAVDTQLIMLQTLLLNMY